MEAASNTTVVKVNASRSSHTGAALTSQISGMRLRPPGLAAAKPEDRWSPRRPRTFKPQLGTLRCDGSTPKENEKEVLRERAKRSSVECETARRANATGVEFKARRAKTCGAQFEDIESVPDATLFIATIPFLCFDAFSTA